MVDAIELGAFARSWAVQRRQIGWLLGAGASAAAGVPAARQIIDDLLLRLYADAYGVVRQHLDVTDPAVLAKVHTAFDGRQGMPRLGTPGDYSAVLECALPDAAARHAYLRQLLTGRTPCYGQRVLAALVVSGHADLLLTTNFDELIERAVVEAHGAKDDPAPLLSVAGLGSVDRAATAFAKDSWPLLIKLHGDFGEANLKNLDAELQEQDASLRRAVIDGSRRFGLAVCGYSGRDDSILQMLRDAAQQPRAFPAGLWWLTRTPERLDPRVRGVLTQARDAGVTAHLVETASFDETMGAIAGQVTLAPDIRRYVDGLRPAARVGQAPLPSGPAARFPVLRLNALPVLDAPTQAWRLPAPAGLTRDALADSRREHRWRGAAVLGAGEVLALGSGSELMTALGASEPPVTVPIDALAADAPSVVRGLAADALTRGLARRLSGRTLTRHGGENLLVLHPAREDAPEPLVAGRAALQAALGGPLLGTLPARLGRTVDGELRHYAEGVRLRLEHALGALWLVFLPFTWTATSAEAVEAAQAGLPRPLDPASDWVRERWVQRKRNEQWAGIIAAWAAVLVPQKPTTRVHVLPRALADSEGALGGAFTLGATTAYSRRSR